MAYIITTLGGLIPIDPYRDKIGVDPGFYCLIPEEFRNEVLEELVRLRAALTLTRAYIEGEPIANAVVAPAGERPNGSHPSLLKTIDAALNSQM